MQVYDQQRQARIDFDLAASRVKQTETNLKLAVLRVAEVKAILDRRQILETSYNDVIIIE
jgi:alpha-D-ribose 1-methylphosphonate 5-triphosphate synthase subunit PhnI